MINSEKKCALAISTNIKKHRKALNLKQRELAEILDVASATVSSWEQGISTPDIDTLFKLCNVFSITMEDIAATQEREENTKNDSSNQIDKKIIGLCYMLDLTSIEKKIIVAYRTGDKLDRRLLERIANN